MGGFELQAMMDAIRSALPSNWVAVLVLGLVIVAFLRSSFARRVTRTVEEMFFTNWRLGLLAATGIVLSVASGWTTWDGMRNFTGEPILSAMVTFGIQGVMLIVAWLIGESFATGMSQQTPNGVLQSRNDGSLKVAMGITLLAILLGAVAVMASYGHKKAVDTSTLWFGAVGLLVVGLLIIASKAHTLRAYFDGMRIIVQSAVLWVMFLACMATSVFFSFDSLFSTIFPQSERQRAAELRAQNQVAGIVADIGSLITARQLSEAEALFATKGWIEYDQQLQKLAREAGPAQREIETYFTGQMEQRRRAVAEQQERIATAQSSQAGLSNKKTALTDELARLKSDRPGLVEEVNQRRETVETTMKELDSKRVEALAEEKGVEGTGKVGRGQMFRQRKAEEDALRDKLKIAEERLREPQRKLQTTDQRIVQIERELSTIDGDIAKLRGETQTAESRIKLAEEAKATEEGALKVDPTRMLPSFERARQEFRQSPRAEGLVEIQRQCAQLVGAMNATPATREKVRGIDCDPKSASESAARVFALNDGLKVFGANCSGGEKLAQHKTADALFEFARKCAQDSGLASKDTDELRQKINFIELSRDDKANRFVVTWNAFNDGNRLAYLALAIAIAIDSLVFMSGLFGANAVRSPLSDVPSLKARSAEQLEAIIDNALNPAPYANARMALDAMHPDNGRPPFTHVVDLGELDPERQGIVRRVLGAGASIDAIHRDERDPNRYFVRRELHEYLAIAGNRAFEKSGEMVKEDIRDTEKLAQLEKDVSVALLPERGATSQADLNYQIALGAQTVLDHLRPYPDPEDSGFRSELRLADFETPADNKIARRVLTAGSNMRLVEIPNYKTRRETSETSAPIDGNYVLHTDFVKTLTRLRARMLLSTSPSALQVGSAAHITRDGGSLSASVPSFPSEPMQAPRLSSPQRPAAAPSEPRPTSVPQRPLPPELPPHAHAFVEPTTTGQSEGEFQRELIEHFGREMGQQSTTIEYLIRHHGQIDVQMLWRSLDLVLRHDEANLRRPMVTAMKNIEQNIDEARASFPSPMMTAPGAAADMNDFADRLKSMSVVMVMLPGAAYDNLINKMEKELEEDNGAGKLDPSRQQKHRIVVAHRSELARAEYTDDHWAAVLQSLMKFEHGLGALAGSDQRPSRLA